MRVFIGPVEISGIGQNLVLGLRSCGVRAELVCEQPHPFAYEGEDVVAWPVRVWQRLGRWGTQRPAHAYLSRTSVLLLQRAMSWIVLVWAIARFDAFIFLYGKTITNTRVELSLLRVLHKRTGAVFVGSDARPAFIDGRQFPSNCPFDASKAAASAAAQRRRVQRLERGVSVVVSQRTTAQFLTRPFVNWFAMGIPRRSMPHPPPSPAAPVRILHSPSNPALKGSAEVRRTVEGLRARGLDVELVTVEGRPNAEVLQALRDCHLVVDQLYSDTPMAAFAAEAASIGRPVIVCGCDADRGAAQVAPLPLPPTVYVCPEQFEAELESMLLDPQRREDVARRCFEFVRDEWSPPAVGERMLRVLRGDIPASWWCSPNEVNHVVGCGLPRGVAREHVSAVIRQGGLAALQVTDKPALEQAFAEFAGVAGS